MQIFSPITENPRSPLELVRRMRVNTVSSTFYELQIIEWWGVIAPNICRTERCKWYEWVSACVSEWVSKWANEWVSEWVSEWAREWVSEWAGQVGGALVLVLLVEPTGDSSIPSSTRYPSSPHTHCPHYTVKDHKIVTHFNREEAY